MRVDDGGYVHPSPWDSPDWRAAALAWVADVLAAHGMTAGGPVDVRRRPWSVVLRVPIEGRPPLWFKANPPGSAWEPALMAALARWAPDVVLTPLAVDPGRSWSLNPDGGEPVALPDWVPTMRAYAGLARATAAHVDALLAIGLPDLRPAGLPARLDELLVLCPSPDVEAARDRIADWCAELDAGGVPAALDHSDLHAAHILAGPRFFDWGDAGVAHPFTSLLVPVRVIRHRYGTDSQPVVERVRDAYLECFDIDLPSGRRLARLACRLAPIGRASTWGRVFPGGPVDGPGQIAAWLARLLEEPPL